MMVATRRHVLGDEHPDTLTAIQNMGWLLQEQGNLSEAESYYREALETQRRVLGDEHLSPDLVRTRWQRGRSAGEEELSLAEFASRPRHARGLDEREFETLVRERLEPPALLRVRWSVAGG